MKKILAIIMILGIAVSTMLCVQANMVNEAEPTIITSIEDERLNGFTPEMLEYIQSKLENGEMVYYGEGTTNPSYLNSVMRGVPTNISNLGSGHAFTFDMTYGNTYYSPWLFRATADATMKIYRTSGTGTAGNINLKIINKTELGEIVYDQNLPMSYNGGTTYIDVVEGNLYYMKVTPLASGQTYAAFVVSQE